MGRIRCWLLMLIASAPSAFAQDADSLMTNADTILSSGDSLSIFSLIDSLLQLETSSSSQLAVRLSYNSNVLSAGRTLGIENFGLSPGVSYYHTSGLYADLSAYWSKDFDPPYYLTVASLGYMRDLSKCFSMMAGYDKYSYHIKNEDTYIPYKNTLSITPIFEFKPVTASINYSFYFGDQYAHRIMPGLSVALQKKKLWKLFRVALTPSFFPLWGNEVVTTIEIVPPKTLAEAIHNRNMFGTRYRTVHTSKNVFGMMNYTISVPLNISFKQWSFSFTYSYNIPKALPGEPETLSESTYLSGSLLYLVNLRRCKNLL